MQGLQEVSATCLQCSSLSAPALCRGVRCRVSVGTGEMGGTPRAVGLQTDPVGSAVLLPVNPTGAEG